MWTLLKEITLSANSESARTVQKRMVKHELGKLLTDHLTGIGPRIIEITEKCVPMGDKFINESEVYTIMVTLENPEETRSLEEPVDDGDDFGYSNEELPHKTIETDSEPSQGQVGGI